MFKYRGISVSDSLLIVGLGNPGKQYENTRHNLGFMVVQKIAKEENVEFKNSSMVNAFLAQYRHNGKTIILAMPTTFMNNSGVAVKKLIKARNIALTNLIIVTDDFSLDFEALRLRIKGSAGGHNGLKSIIQHLGQDEFPRLRMGIGKPEYNVTDFVLGKFPRQQEDKLARFIDNAVGCCRVWIDEGIHNAMDQYNTRKEK